VLPRACRAWYGLQSDVALDAILLHVIIARVFYRASVRLAAMWEASLAFLSLDKRCESLRLVEVV